MKYIAQIVKDTLARSEKPKPRYIKTIGNVAQINPPKKLSRSLNLTFSSINSPIIPKTNKTPSKMKIVLADVYPNLKNNEIINEKNGGLSKSEYPMP